MLAHTLINYAYECIIAETSKGLKNSSLSGSAGSPRWRQLGQDPAAETEKGTR